MPVRHDDLDMNSLCYLTTTGRVTGRPHRIEIWFSLHGPTLYLLSGGARASDWVRNLQADPEVLVEIGPTTLRGLARLLRPGSDEDRTARDLVHGKYQPGYGGDLSSWREASSTIAVDLEQRSDDH